MRTHADGAGIGRTAGTDGLFELIARRGTGPAAGRAYLTSARTGRQVTYEDLAHAVHDWLGEFDRRGAHPGSRVALAVADPLDFAAVFLATVATGRCAVPLPARAPGPELARSLATLTPDLVVADHAITTGQRALTPDAWGGGGGGAGGGVLLASSGTTGTPKQVLLDAGRLLHVATAIARHHQLTAADVGFNSLPLVHVNAEVVGLLATLVAGGELVLDERFHRKGFWNLVQSRGVTWINAVPAILAILARGPAPSAAQTRTVRFARSASAPLPAAVLIAFEARTGLPVVETYGMTEAASQITANPVGGRRRPGSVGRPVGTEVRIVDEDGRPLGRGQVGRVQIRGRGVISAYATQAGDDLFRPGGWLETGDLGQLDTDGYLFLVGRTDDVINRGGEKIFPREVEEVLLADARVARAVVYGLPHEVLGQVPAARVQLAGPADGAERRAPHRRGPAAAAAAHGLLADLSERCAAQLDRHKRPVRIEVVDDIPVGQTGKVLRRLIEPGQAVDGSEAA
ncbi:AMP-binding protein [Pseudofrankia sp. BMG5.36]|uniref:AMP-binding protein n=1 Tax=Pseudofrankia sp. BMG5.36 TaxID=1834512 RepID=UPI0008DA298D|nr:AMP-binding protein [Pseudofrankia sp. BMG5.36]OHV56937.1 hypothetical protein BCD48_00735 [Pseudofrankia sp. BMG5.36]